ncbi:MAG: DNA translocase FtsK [Treponema sp.]|nr:DNA translocase FtsK [Treponema sp.]
MNRIYGAEETETVSEETSEPVIHEVTKEDETIAEETPAFEEEPLAEEEVTFKEEPLAEEISESENFDDIEESEIPDFTADFGDEDEDIFGSWDSPSDGSEPQTEEVAAEEPEESEESFEEPFHDDNPADFINIEDIAESPSDEEGDSMGVDDIFSEMDADAAENPVFKAQPAPAAHDSLYQPETIAETETAVVPEEDEDSDEEDKILNQIDEINEINFDDEDFEEPDVVTEEEIAETEEESEIAESDEDSEKEKNGMRKLSEYKIPTDLLEKFENDEYWRIDEETKAAGENLKKTLNEFGIEAEVTGIRKGPVVTMFELLPAPGVKLSKIVNLQDNIALALAAKSVRIVAPIPGRHAVGIEIPNKERAVVSFREIIEQDLPEFKKMSVPVILGKDISGQSQIIDIAKTPHLLIAGATGAGKSVCVNSIILSILYNRSPKDVKLIMVDPKVVELKLYNDIPHLLTPVVTEPKRALQVLQYCICEMERRYALLDGMGVRDIVSYNTRIRERKIATEKLPYIVVIIDEFADLMATSGKELESNVARLTAMSRAVGIHLVLATQRPSVNVITGLIKANIPSRIAFMVASRQDSQIIIDSIGAEKLLGKGDMLYTSAVNPIPTRIQGTLVGDNEVERVVDYVKTFGGPDYIDDEIFVDDDEEEESEPGLFSDGEDPLYDQALQIVIQTGKASASYLQRRLKIGYNRAARLVEEMEERGIVGPANGSKPREIIHMP